MEHHNVLEEPPPCAERLVAPGEAQEGVGRSSGHHGEILHGAFRAPDGRMVHGRMALPCSSFAVQARFVPGTSPRIEVDAPPGHALSRSRRAVQLGLEALGVPASRAGGRLQLRSTIPRRRGLGASRAEVMATLRAVADAHGEILSESQLARLALAAEPAVPPWVFSADRFEGELPAMSLLSIDTDPCGTGIDTRAQGIPRYSNREIDQFQRLKLELERGLARRDVATIATVATASAYLNERYLPKPRLTEIASVGFRMGAMGLQVTHRGSMVGLIFAPAAGAEHDRLKQCECHLRSQGFGTVARFDVGTVVGG